MKLALAIHRLHNQAPLEVSITETDSDSPPPAKCKRHSEKETLMTLFRDLQKEKKEDEEKKMENVKKKMHDEKMTVLKVFWKFSKKLLKLKHSFLEFNF